MAEDALTFETSGLTDDPRIKAVWSILEQNLSRAAYPGPVIRQTSDLERAVAVARLLDETVQDPTVTAGYMMGKAFTKSRLPPALDLLQSLPRAVAETAGRMSYSLLAPPSIGESVPGKLAHLAEVTEHLEYLVRAFGDAKPGETAKPGRDQDDKDTASLPIEEIIHNEIATEVGRISLLDFDEGMGAYPRLWERYGAALLFLDEKQDHLKGLGPDPKKKEMRDARLNDLAREFRDIAQSTQPGTIRLATKTAQRTQAAKNLTLSKTALSK